MKTGTLIFVLIAILNIILLSIRWIRTGDEQVSAIVGWICAIGWAIEY
jgi:hypothetical protein